MIDRDHTLSTSTQARLLKMSRSSVFPLPKPTSAADLELMRQIDELHLMLPFMGSRQVSRELSKRGNGAGRLHVRRVMVKMGIEALEPNPAPVSANRSTSARVCLSDDRLHRLQRFAGSQGNDGHPEFVSLKKQQSKRSMSCNCLQGD